MRSRLETTVDLLDALQERYGWDSDRQIALALEVPQATISSWRRGRSSPTDLHAFKIAEALGISPAYVLLIGAADRSARTCPPEVHAEWRKIVRQIARGGAAALAALLVGTAHYGPQERPQETRSGSPCILRQVRRRASQAKPYAA